MFKKQQFCSQFNQILLEPIEENNNIVGNITASVENQHSGSEQIQKATEEINNITQNVSASTEEMAGSTTDLHNLANPFRWNKV